MCGCSWRLTHGWLSVWMSEWTSEADAGSEWASESSERRGEERDVRAAAGDYWLHNGWREAEEWEREAAAVVVWGWDGLGRGLSRAERGPRPRGTLTQRAADMEALCGLDCVPLAAGARAPATEKRQEEEENKGQEREPSIHASTSPHSALCTQHCTALSPWPDHCYSP